MNRTVLFLSFLFALAQFHTSFGCTNLLVTSGASLAGNNMITYNADDFTAFGSLQFFPAGNHPPGTMRRIVDGDDGTYHGEIPEAPHTFNVVGNLNEHGLSIAESTFDGIESLATQPGAIMDYTSLMTVALQRARTAREAIAVMANLTDTYGYFSTGESFSLTDPTEVWIMDWIGKGPGERGAVWVAQRVPAGYVSAHANQARTRTFPLNNSDACIYAPDIISFAVRKGLYPQGAPPENFDFQAVFDPITPEGARICEGRVWSMFQAIADDSYNMSQYLNYVQGVNLSNPMPLWIKPRQGLSVNDTINLMRNHYEGTWFDMRVDVSAGPYAAPYRWRPLDWQVGTQQYVWARPVATEQTAFAFVAEIRDSLPAPLKGMLWFGLDDSSGAVHVPIYGAVTDVATSYGDNGGYNAGFSFHSAFWVFNMVNNLAYGSYSLIYPDVYKAIVAREAQYFAEVPKIDAEAAALVLANKTSDALDLITKYSRTSADTLVTDWLSLWQTLFFKFMDGTVRNRDPSGARNPVITNIGYTQPWLQRVVAEAGAQYRVPPSPTTSPSLRRFVPGMAGARRPRARPKSLVRGV